MSRVHTFSGQSVPGFLLFKDANGWPDNDFYEGWWGHNTLPKLNYEGSEKLYQYVLDIAKRWLSPPYLDRWLASRCGGGSRSFAGDEPPVLERFPEGRKGARI